MAITVVPMIVGSFGVACSKDSSTSTTPAGSTPTSTAAVSTTSATASGPAGTKVPTPSLPGAVSIVDFEFAPASQTVKVGEKVTWTNEDPTAHFVKADDGAGADFSSGDMESKKTFSFTFDKAGTYKYHCNIHTSMKGTIVVS